MTDPLRPLGSPGIDLWERARADRVFTPAQLELLQMACEHTDERASLRVRVLRDNDPNDRRALRELDRLIVDELSKLGLFTAQRETTEQPSADVESW